MAKISDVTLAVEQHDAVDQWEVTVSYKATFEPWERGTWFAERVEMFGVGDSGERLLATLVGPAFVATDASAQHDSFVLHRMSPTFTLSADTLDVRPDLQIVEETPAGYDVTIIRRVDEVYALVVLAPKLPRGDHGRSASLAGQFGARV